MKYPLEKIFFISLMIFSLALLTNAQTDQIGNTSNLYISISPSNPRPGQTTTLTVGSNIQKLDGASISWFLNDILKLEGLGEKKFTFDTNKNGNKDTVKAVVIIGDYKETVSREILPTEVDIIVENDSYTMPFYKGRSYFAPQGTTKIIAIPNIIKDGVRVPEKDLLFKWKNDNKVLLSSSGAGKNVLSITGSIPIKDIDVDVEVSTADGSIKANRNVYFSTTDAIIFFYENSPSYGLLFNKAISGNYDLQDKEEIIIDAFPFGFAVKDENSSDLKYKWSINNTSVSLDEKPNKMVLRQTGTGAGIANVALKIENIKRIFQFNNSGFIIQFGKQDEN